jgi:amino acid adenylation domain-containing protein
VSTPDDERRGMSAADRLRREVVARRMAGATAAEVPSIPRAARTADLPASFAQERLWLLDKLAPSADGYVLAFGRRIRGGLDLASWQGALDDLVGRHEVLRTALTDMAGRPAQQIAEQLSVPLEQHAAPDFDSALTAARKFASRRFDLAVAPPVRAGVWTFGADEHVVVVSVHHAACDGWSGRILMAELAQLYRARLSGVRAVLPELPVQYGDFAAWQRGRVSGGLLDRQLGYWREALAGVPVLELPADRPRPAVWTGRGGVVELALPGGLVAGLDELARASGATLFMVLLAAFQVVLGRWSGQDDVAVGTPVAGRGRVELEGLIGLFVNTLVLRGDLSGEPSFAEFLGRVREGALGAFDHQDVPFERLVEELRPERDLSRNPLFQAWLVLQNYEAATEAGGPDLEYLELDGDTAFAQFDISLMVYPVADGLTAQFTYAADLFEHHTVARLAGHLVRVLGAVVTDPAVSVSRLALLSDAERAELMRLAGSGTSSPEPLATVGTGASVVCARQVVSGAELDGLAGGLALELAARGIGRGSLVGVCLPRGIWSVAAMLAVWRVGAVYVPLDLAFPAGRLRRLVAESGVRLVIGEADLGVPALTVHGVEPRDGVPAAEVTATDLAYVIFTSGSAGQPKAVGVEHGAIARHVSAVRECFGITAADRILAFSAFTFDASLDQLLPALAAGATIVVRPDMPWLPSAVPAVVREHGITVANFPPAFWAQLTSGLTERDAAGLSSLRLLILGGDVVPVRLLTAWRARLPRVRVLNAYGPTEATVTATVHEVVPGGTRVPIGRPLGARRGYVVDRHDELVPLGVPGELLIGGPELARGYLGRPDLTAERFAPNPFAPGRVYRTGDRVRWLPDGTLEFLGRLDDQVKIRGIRVEFGEVEAALAGCPGVQAAAAAVRPDAQDGQTLVGYVAASGPLDVGVVREWCARSLPAYLVPSHIVVVDELPVNASGKLDRAALPAPASVRSAGAQYAPPRDETERLVATIWAEVLGVDRVGLDDGFFDLGGHSLLATMAVSRIAERLGREVELRALFEHPRLREFGPLVAGTRVMTTDKVATADRAKPLPMSFAQQRLWFLDRLSERGDDYLLWFSWRVRGEIDRLAWQGALDDVVARHEVLRTELVELDGQPLQRIRHHLTMPLSWHEVGDEQSALAAATEFASRRFDLAVAPLVRAGVWRLGQGDAVAMIAFHHAATDGWSSRIFLAEFSACYRARLSGVRAVLPELPVQYGDFAAWQRGRVSGGLLDRQLGYWREALAGVPVLELPADRPRPAVWTGRGGVVELALPGGLVAGLDELARASGATLFMVLLAAFQVVLGRWSGQDDVAVGTPVAGRGRVELEGLIGLFVNTLVLRGDLSGEPSFAEFLGRVREGALGAFDHQDVPFERLVEELRPERDLSRNPLFQVMFDLQESGPARLDAPGLTLESCALPWSSAKFDLTATFVVRPGEFSVEVEYSRDLFDEPTVRRLGDHLARVLAAVVAHPDAGIWELDLLAPDERAELLTLVGSAQPSAAPLELAGTGATLICGTDTVSGAELDRLVNGLAAGLAARGAGPGSAVGVCLSRGVWSVLAMLAVWRAGGVYVPLDPGLPLARLAFMVQEAGVGWVVADARTADVATELDATVVPVGQVAPVAEFAPVAGELAYVIFTSGSSGRPKAVAVGHEALARHVAAATERFEVTAADTVLTFASFSFDASLEQVLPALSRGARLVIRPDELWTPEELGAQVRTHGVTLLELTPAYWEEVVPRLEHVAGDLASLRMLVTGGEALPSPPLRAWFNWLPGVPIMNTYGPTECTISATAFLVTGPVAGRVPIGRPLGARRLYVVDARGVLVPPGMPGELLVGGPELAQGYLGRPELTAERFVPGPSGAGLVYRTGDRVRWRPDGNLEFLGRADDQVKIRGFRIEPGEVEAVLNGFDGVRGAAVVVRDDTLTGYVAGDGLDPAVLAAHCRRWLPDYMLPVIVVLEALPLTVQGKVDIGSLPASAAAQPTGFLPPRSPTELVIAQIWAEVLSADQVSLQDNFFALGGHSMRAVAAASRLRTAFGCPVEVRHVFENPTVERLSAYVERQLAEQISAMSEDEIELFLTPGF